MCRNKTKKTMATITPNLSATSKNYWFIREKSIQKHHWTGFQVSDLHHPQRKRNEQQSFCSGIRAPGKESDPGSRTRKTSQGGAGIYTSWHHIAQAGPPGCRHHFVFQFIAFEKHSTSTLQKYILRPFSVNIQPQIAAILLLPIFIEIDHKWKFPTPVAFKLIQSRW